MPRPSPEPVPTRIGDFPAMLRIMQSVNGQLLDPVVGNRKMLANLCRFIGVQVGTLSPESIGFPPEKSPAVVAPEIDPRLSPRQQQTLQHLLGGDSEKQVARKMKISQNTVHGYVKALYRHFGVNSRAELLAKHMNRLPVNPNNQAPNSQ